MMRLDLFEGVVLGVVAQQRTWGGIPLWVFLLVALLVIIVGVIWFLYEERQKAQKQSSADRVAAVSKTVESPQIQQPAAIPAPVEPDDLTVIEGIGPKISGLLQAAGVTTLAQLAETDVAQIRQILEDAGLIRLADPTTWPEQAKLAAAGDWQALQKLQDELQGGRRV
ncbi:MAG: DUF4332 domain-containing protein [Anaerolineae bacterium]|nr:DUF4332 domain-containing protein [Anaerolineae bacterium]